MNTRKVCTAGACALVLGVGCLLFSQVAPKSGPAVNQESLIIQDFENRIADYVKLHKEIQAGFPAQKPTDSAAELAEYRLQMAPKIRAATAKQADIFTSEISGSFRRLIGAPFSGPEGDHLRASLRHAEPVHGTRLHVNATYPAKVPLQSTPPTLLLDLPQLPSEVEYRIVGRDLVLRDVGANLAMFWFAGSS